MNDENMLNVESTSVINFTNLLLCPVQCAYSAYELYGVRVWTLVEHMPMEHRNHKSAIDVCSNMLNLLLDLTLILYEYAYACTFRMKSDG